MSLPSSPEAPIYKLDRDILWHIFYINSWHLPNDSPDGHDVDSPLTITRNCSQVCSFWRNIILESPSIWGNCIDLDLLVTEHEHDDLGSWFDEVLRRTGDALLSIYADAEITPSSDQCEFLEVLIYNEWKRIQAVDVIVESVEVISRADLWITFGRPAKHLRVFCIESGEPDADESPNDIILPPGFRLFSDDAPVLTKFSLFSNHEIIIPLATHPFPPIFLTAQLRHLCLCQSMEVPAADALAACKQMPYLEVLIVRIARPIPANTGSPPLGDVTLPRLMKLEVLARNLDVFPGFLGHLTARPGCALDVRTSFEPSDVQLPEMMNQMKANIIGMYRALSHYMTSFFDHHQDEPNCVTELELNISNTAIGFTTTSKAQSTCGFFITPDHHNNRAIPPNVLGPVIKVISYLKFPKTIVRLRLDLFDIIITNVSPSSTQHYLSVGFRSLAIILKTG